MFFAFGAGFFVLVLLNGIPGYKPLVVDSPWIPKVIGDSIAFAAGLLIIFKISRRRLKDYGFRLKGKNFKIKLSLILGILLGLLGIILDHFYEWISGAQFKPVHTYPLTAANILGMMTFQWIFVGIFEETITRGLVQTYLMEKLNGTVTFFKWNFHIGSIITAMIFGVGHFGPHFFFGGSLLTLAPHLLFAILCGLCLSYVYQESRSLVGPILMHNVVDGLLYSVDFLFY
jgi:membrane protease YdiL (CAAX protease family)